MSASSPTNRLAPNQRIHFQGGVYINVEAYDRLEEQFDALDDWSRDVLPQLSRLIDIIEGRHEEARLVPPHGQSSATPHALLDRWRSLHSNPAIVPSSEAAASTEADMTSAGTKRSHLPEPPPAPLPAKRPS